MKKKIIIIIVVTISVVALMFVGRNIITNNRLKAKRERFEKRIENDVKQGVEKLSDEAKKELNYDELLADVKSIMHGESCIYAKESESSKYVYYGKGYYYKDYPGADMIYYAFDSSVDNTRIYTYEKYVPMKNGVSKTAGENFLELLDEYKFEVAVILIGAISCVVVYVKERNK